MVEWGRVKWSEAGQVLDILDTPPDARVAAATASPADYFLALRAAERRVDAVKFLGQALPRLESVAWAARAVRDLRGAGEMAPAEARALRTVLLWVQDATEPRRRATFDAAEACDPVSAERLAALAAFFSGGSIAPPDCQPLPAPRDAAGKFAAGAVLVAAAGRPDMTAALDACLDAGQALAETGLEGVAE
jgi:hypothetical protein